MFNTIQEVLSYDEQLFGGYNAHIDDQWYGAHIDDQWYGSHHIGVFYI